MCQLQTEQTGTATGLCTIIQGGDYCTHPPLWTQVLNLISELSCELHIHRAPQLCRVKELQWKKNKTLLILDLLLVFGQERWDCRCDSDILLILVFGFVVLGRWRMEYEITHTSSHNQKTAFCVHITVLLCCGGKDKPRACSESETIHWTADTCVSPTTLTRRHSPESLLLEYTARLRA